MSDFAGKVLSYRKNIFVGLIGLNHLLTKQRTFTRDACC